MIIGTYYVGIPRKKPRKEDDNECKKFNIIETQVSM